MHSVEGLAISNAASVEGNADVVLVPEKFILLFDDLGLLRHDVIGHEDVPRCRLVCGCPNFQDVAELGCVDDRDRDIGAAE